MGDQIETMQDLLHDLSSQGRLDSSGDFTLDPFKALEKMAHFQLRSPYEYVLKLVQSAVSAGATEIRLDQNGSDFSLLFDKAPFTWENIKNLPDHALQNARTPLSHLAVAVNCMLALKPAGLELVSWDPKSYEGLRLIWEQGRERIEKVKRGPSVPRTRLRLRGRHKPAAGMLGPAWAGWGDSLVSRSLGDYGAEFRAQWDSEYSQIWRRCLLAPVPIVLNGRAINRPFFGKPKSYTQMPAGQAMNIDVPELDEGFQLVCQILSEQCWPGCLVGASMIPRRDQFHRRGRTDYRWYTTDHFPSPPGSWTRLARVEMDADARRGLQLPQALIEVDQAGVATLPRLALNRRPAVACHALLARLPESRFSDSLGYLALLQDGVVLSKTFPPRPALEGWCILAKAKGLETDLSQFSVRDTPAYQELLDTLEQAIRTILAQD